MPQSPSIGLTRPTYVLCLRRVFRAARDERLYGLVPEAEFPALQHHEQRLLKRQRAAFEEFGAEQRLRLRVERAEVNEAYRVLLVLSEVVAELAVEFGDDATVLAVDVVQQDLRVKRWAASAAHDSADR